MSITKKIFFAFLICFNQGFAQTNAEIKTAIAEGLYKDFCGKVQIKKTDPKSLLLFFSTKDGDENIYDKSILIETNKHSDGIEFSNNDDCEIFIPMSRRFIVVHNKTKGKIVYLGLYDVENKIQSVSANLKGSDGSYFMGYGLSYMENKWSRDIVNNEASINADVILLNSNQNILEEKKGEAPNLNPGGMTCDSGGPGSSQCSVEEGFPVTQVCSVTCNAGFYACCDTGTFKCKCIVNPTSNN